LQEVLVRQYIAEILLALEYLHEREILHRDLKPENVLLDAERHCLLTDFGLSKERLGQSLAKSFVGSLAYIAPEIILKRGYDHSVDLWSLGVLMFVMLTGRPPFFADRHNREMMKHHIVQTELDFQPYPFVSANAGELILLLRTHDPLTRLGARRTADVRHHPFLFPVNFDAVFKREVPILETAPRVPLDCNSGATHSSEFVSSPFEDKRHRSCRLPRCGNRRRNQTRRSHHSVVEWSYF
jgi:serine/threonine protein kinase